MRTPDEFRDEGVRNAAGAHALANAAAHLIAGDQSDHAVLQACAYLLHQAGNLADHAALMFRLAEPSDDASADSEPKEG